MEHDPCKYCCRTRYCILYLERRRLVFRRGLRGVEQAAAAAVAVRGAAVVLAARARVQRPAAAARPTLRHLALPRAARQPARAARALTPLAPLARTRGRSAARDHTLALLLSTHVQYYTLTAIVHIPLHE